MAFQKRIISQQGITVIQKRDPALTPLRPGKVAIVLAGGAVAGGGYKAGGLQALQEVFSHRRGSDGVTRAFGLNDFDIFVGLSAGSVLASVLAAGITADEIIRILEGTSTRYSAFRPWHFMSPNLREPPERLLMYLDKQQEILTNYLSAATDPRTGDAFSLRETLIKMTTVLTRLVPTGLFDVAALEKYLRDNMERNGIPNDFGELHRKTGKELYMSATDINRGELVVFGPGEPYGQIPISEAVAASSALPFWYRTCRVQNPRGHEDREPEFLDLADGGIMRTANVRVAIEKGAELVICYNPFNRILYDRAGRSLYEHGAYALMNQIGRILIGARLDIAKELVFASDVFDADVVFVEPAADDYYFFLMNPLNFWSKERAALHGYQSVRGALEANHDILSEVFRAHGIELRARSPKGPRSALPQHVDLRESRGAG